MVLKAILLFLVKNTTDLFQPATLKGIMPTATVLRYNNQQKYHEIRLLLLEAYKPVSV